MSGRKAQSTLCVKGSTLRFHAGARSLLNRQSDQDARFSRPVAGAVRAETRRNERILLRHEHLALPTLIAAWGMCASQLRCLTTSCPAGIEK